LVPNLRLVYFVATYGLRIRGVNDGEPALGELRIELTKDGLRVEPLSLTNASLDKSVVRLRDRRLDPWASLWLPYDISFPLRPELSAMSKMLRIAE